MKEYKNKVKLPVFNILRSDGKTPKPQSTLTQLNLIQSLALPFSRAMHRNWIIASKLLLILTPKLQC